MYCQFPHTIVITRKTLTANLTPYNDEKVNMDTTKGFRLN